MACFERFPITIRVGQFHVDPGPQSQGGCAGFIRSHMVIAVDHYDGLVIRDNQPIKTEFAAQQVGQDGREAATSSPSSSG